MTRYQKYMQHIHNQATAINIEQAILCFADDVIEYLIKTGVKKDSDLLNNIKALQTYQYKSIKIK